MAHFAQLDENNVVINVIVVKNNELLDENGQESEIKGVAFCQSIFGANTRWVQTSYNHNFRKKFAGIDDIYIQANDIFVGPAPYPSWTLQGDPPLWTPPVPFPEDVRFAPTLDNIPINYSWDETTQSWIKLLPATPPEV